MARRSPGPAGVGTVLGGIAAALVLAGCAVPFSGNGPSSGSAGGERIVICESGITSVGGIDTSSAVAVRLPVGAPLPPGCRES